MTDAANKLVSWIETYSVIYWLVPVFSITTEGREHKMKHDPSVTEHTNSGQNIKTVQLCKEMDLEFLSN